jgi:uncharacterized membrane protein YoaK (UPF0700 family)
MRSPDATPSRQLLTVPLLAVVGGSVDAIVRLGLGVLAAAQTGNTILLAASIAERRFSDTLQSAVSLAGYVAGTALGAAIVSRIDGDSQRRAVRVILYIELCLLIALIAVWWFADRSPVNGTRSSLIALAGVAMGLQSAAVLAMHVRPSTTYITGTLTAFTTELVEQSAGDETYRGHDAQVGTRPPRDGDWGGGGGRGGLFMMDQPWVYGTAWFVYAIGALVGALLFQWLGFASLLLPLAAIVVVLGIEFGSRHAR